MRTGDTNPILGAYLKLNRIQIDVHKGNKLRKEQLRELERIANIDSPYTKMGANILLERWEEAERSLEKCLALGPAGRIHIKDWPIVSLLKPHLKRKSVVTKLKKAR